MKILSLFLGLLMATPLWAATTDISNPQSMMVGARVMSLGGTNPVVAGDINGVFINPAIISFVDAMPLSFTNQKVLDAFDYLVVNSSIPIDLSLPFTVEDRVVTQKLLLGLSYGSVSLGDIPETVNSDGILHSVGSFSSGFYVLEGHAGTVFYDLLGFDALGVGAGAKLVTQYVKSRKRSGLSFDFGAIGEYYMDTWGMDKLSLGVSVLNLISTPMTWTHTQDKSSLPLELYLGARADFMDERLALYAHNSLHGVMVASEYMLSDGFQLRGSTNLGFSRFNLGTGLLFGHIQGFSDQDYRLRLDYNFSMNPAPFTEDLTHALSVTVLGDTKPFSPRILTPAQDLLMSDLVVDLAGVGPKETEVRIYNNGVMVRSVRTDRNGRWEYANFPLKEGKNELYIRSYTIEKELSEQSEILTIVTDSVPPELDMAVYTEENSLVVVALASEDTVDMLGAINGDPMVFAEVSTGVWESRVPRPDYLVDGAPVQKTMNIVDLAAVDEAGNEAVISEIPFFATVAFPDDQHVHLKERVRVIGSASPMVKSIRFGEDPVYIDNNDRFSFSQKLLPGKNLVEMNITTLNDRTLTQTLRVLRLATFKDLTDDVRGRRTIELMATLGVLPGNEDDTFTPEKLVDRRYLAKMLATSLELPVSDVEQDLFSDVLSTDDDAKYIRAVIEEGLMFAYPDGSFRGNEALTLNEILSALNGAAIVEIDEDEELGDDVMSRAEFARYLSFLPQFELMIEDLGNWATGYRP